jgi:hypothetical protein
MLKNRQDEHLISNDYDQVRNDLHPNTRREFILRLLAEISEFPADQLKASSRNIQKDSGQALSESNSMQVKTSLATRISSGLVVLANKLDASEIVSWWANVLHGIGEPSEELAQLLNSEIRSGLRHTNPLVQLSSIFGLARLHVPDIASIASEASSANPEWSTNAALVNWLRQLSDGSTSYPDRRMLKSI